MTEKRHSVEKKGLFDPSISHLATSLMKNGMAGGRWIHAISQMLAMGFFALVKGDTCLGTWRPDPFPVAVTGKKKLPGATK
jgi:hypothetical protein